MNIKKEINGLRISAGYDRRMDYTFMVIMDKEGEILYSNIYEPDPFSVRDFDFFFRIAKEQFNVELWDLLDAVNVFKININQTIEEYKERLEDDDLGQLIPNVRY